VEWYRPEGPMHAPEIVRTLHAIVFDGLSER